MPEPKRKHASRFIVWGVLLLVFALVFYWVLHHHEEAAASTSARRGAGGVVPVVPATVKRGDIGVYQEAIGTVTPVFTASLTAQITGVITAVHYREGQLVRKGQPPH